MKAPTLVRAAVSAFAVAAALPAAAQAPPGDESVQPPERDQSAPQVYVPLDFSAFAPRNALDLVERIPGFQISGSFGGFGDSSRGLGEASGNLLINGDRISSKSTSTRDQLSRIPVDNVVRIEIVDGASLEIPGLSGRVANVIIRETGGLSGQFAWRPFYATETERHRLLRGDASLRGTAGPVDFTLSADAGGRLGGETGLLLVTDGLGEEDEYALLRRDSFRRYTLSGIFAIDVAPDVRANLNLSGGLVRFRAETSEIRTPANPLPDAAERFNSRNNEHSYEIGADIEFPLGPGRLKLIGLESFEKGNFVTRSLLEQELENAVGTEFGRPTKTGERIGRGEYGWQLWGADWQISAEAAFNRLDQEGTLAVYDPLTEAFVPVPFPSGSGGVREERYESILSYGRPITETLSMQFAGGAETSTLSQTGADANSRSFLRPKGQLSLAWAPEAGLDISLEVARRVGQLSFGDFLASVNLTDDTENVGNNNLRPQQSWETELEIAKRLGVWGSGTVQMFDHRIEDLLIILLLDNGGEARGNLESAHRYGVRLNGTLELAPVGIAGAKIDFRFAAEKSSLVDPVTGIKRRFDGLDPFSYNLDYRHDVPGSNWAYGAGVNNATSAFDYRVREFTLQTEATPSASLFVEHKDVFGLTVRTSVFNLFDREEVRERTVFDRPRGPEAALLFSELRRQRSGQSVQFSVSGSF